MEEFQNPQTESQNAEPVNKLNSAAVNGLKLAVISIVISLIASFLPQSGTGFILSFIISLIKLGATVTFLWWAMKTFSTQNAAVEGFTTYGKVFSYGLLTSLFSGIVLAAYNFIYMKWIAPETTESLKETTMAQLEQINGIDTSFIEMYMNNLEVWSAVGALISAMFYGLIFSAILASSTKINPNPMHWQNNQ